MMSRNFSEIGAVVLDIFKKLNGKCINIGLLRLFINVPMIFSSH